ncbi:MAG: HAD-IIIA family hydrolase [Eubacteriales bacterium]|nr:HAD-IIIA family hydrolase [Eubacteriales bacterium]
MKTAVIFDLDGTLLNTLEDLRSAVNASLTLRDLPPRTTEEVQAFVGNGVRNLMKRALPQGTSDGEINEALADFKSYYAAHLCDKTVPYDGIPELLKELKRRGIKVAVLSNKLDAASKQLMAHYFGEIFDVVFGERAGIPRKPDPTSCNEIVQLLAVPKDQILYVGDSGVDMQTAKNAGLYAVGVMWGFRDRSVLLDGGADALIDRPDQLFDHLYPEQQIARVRKALESRGFTTAYFDTKEQAIAYLAQETEGKSVSLGGSVTLDEMNAYEILGRKSDVSWHWKGDGYRQDADVYVSSVNALSETGEAVNIDGRGNRVAGTLYGAKEVFLVCGRNKLVPTLAEAIDRAQNLAAPRNAVRLEQETPCAVRGGDRCYHCRSPKKICRATVILHAPMMGTERYEIVLVGESLGY